MRFREMLTLEVLFQYGEAFIYKYLDYAIEHLEPHGHYKAILSLDCINSVSNKADGKLILTTAIGSTPVTCNS
jgi:formyltetrahydrofolate synthetase